MIEPDKMLAEGDPIAKAMYDAYGIPMPNFRLETQEVNQLLEYIRKETERLRARALRQQAASMQFN